MDEYERCAHCGVILSEFEVSLGFDEPICLNCLDESAIIEDALIEIEE